MIAPSRWQPVAAAPVSFFKLCLFVVLFFVFDFRINHSLFMKVVTMAGLSSVNLLRILLFFFILIFVTENLANSSGGIVYTREQLIVLCKPVLLPRDRSIYLTLTLYPNTK